MHGQYDPIEENSLLPKINSFDEFHVKYIYHTSFAHLLALIIMTFSHQLFSFISLMLAIHNFDDLYNVYYQPKISVLRIMMIIDLISLLIVLFFMVFLKKSTGTRVWVAVLVLFLIAISLFFYVYEIVTFITYIQKSEKVTLIIGIFLRILLMIYMGVFLVYKGKLARERKGNSEEVLIVDVGINAGNVNDNNDEKKYELTVYFIVLMDLLKMEILNQLIISILFGFYIFRDNSLAIIAGDVFSWIDFTLVTLAFFLFIYSKGNRKLFKFGLLLVWAAVGTITLAYALTFLETIVYDEKWLYAFTWVGFSATLRVCVLIFSSFHYFKRKFMDN